MRRVQQAGEKLTSLLGDLQQLTLKLYPEESQDIRNHLVLQDGLKGFDKTQFNFKLRKTIWDKEMNIADALEREFHLESVIRIETEEQTPRRAAIWRCKKDILGDSKKRCVKIILGAVTVKEDGRETRHEGNRYWGKDSRDRARTPTPRPNTRKKMTPLEVKMTEATFLIKI